MIGALKPPGDLLENPLVPGPFTLDNFRQAWSDGRLDRYLLNSLIVASIITIGQVVTSVMSGYAFSMLDYPGRNLLFVLFISTMLVPLEATLVGVLGRQERVLVGLIALFPIAANISLFASLLGTREQEAATLVALSSVVSLALVAVAVVGLGTVGLI